MKLDTQTGEVRVYVSKKVIHDDGTICHAIFTAGTPATIEVEENENIEVMERNVFHELVHNGHEGLSDKELARIYGDCNEKTCGDREEDNALFLEKTLFETLKRNKLLKFPKPPKLA